MLPEFGNDRPYFSGRQYQPDSPAGRYLQNHGVERKDFNSYGSRRGNHEVMMRGTFASCSYSQRNAARRRERVG